MSFAHSNHIASDINYKYIDEKDLKSYKEVEIIIKQEESLYKKQIKDYKKELSFKSQIFQTLLNTLQDSISPHINKNHINESDDILSIIARNNHTITYTDSKNIESLSLNDLQDTSKLAYFYCLYHCNNLIVLDSKNKAILDKNTAIKNFGYKNDFANIFIFNKDSVTQEYLESRKELYKSFMLLKQERIESIEKEKQRLQSFKHKTKLCYNV